MLDRPGYGRRRLTAGWPKHWPKQGRRFVVPWFVVVLPCCLVSVFNFCMQHSGTSRHVVASSAERPEPKLNNQIDYCGSRLRNPSTLYSRFLEFCFRQDPAVR